MRHTLPLGVDPTAAVVDLLEEASALFSVRLGIIVHLVDTLDVPTQV